MTAPVLTKESLLKNEHESNTWQNKRMSFATYGDDFHSRLHGGYGSSGVFMARRIVPAVVASSPRC